MIDYKVLGRRIKAKRKTQRRTQEDIAREIGISLSFYGNIERGLRVPSLETLVSIANALSASLDDLLAESLLYHKTTNLLQSVPNMLQSDTCPDSHDLL